MRTSTATWGPDAFSDTVRIPEVHLTARDVGTRRSLAFFWYISPSQLAIVVGDSNLLKVQCSVYTHGFCLCFCIPRFPHFSSFQQIHFCFLRSQEFVLISSHANIWTQRPGCSRELNLVSSPISLVIIYSRSGNFFAYLCRFRHGKFIHRNLIDPECEMNEWCELQNRTHSEIPLTGIAIGNQ